MIRYSALWTFIIGLIWYARRDWVKSLGALIVLLAVLERPDMPKEIFGIQGLNPFNLALLGILLIWGAERLREPAGWNVPRSLTILFGLYVSFMALSTARMLLDPSYLLVWQGPDFAPSSMTSLIAEYVFNTFKWLVPAVLLVQGCRGEDRYRWVLICVLLMYAGLAILVIKQMPLGYLLDGERLQQRAADILQIRVGYHRVDLATMFAGASWAMLAARPMFPNRWIRLGLVGLSAITTLGLALTGGRTGYTAWCLIGLTLAILKWRRYLLLVPVAVALVFILAPGIPQRMLQGLGGDSRDTHLVLSGRNVVWPVVIEKIKEGPVIGHGRQAWVRTNLRMQTALRTGESFGHPHNAYFEFALDTGVFGLGIVVLLFGSIIWNAGRMFRSRDNPTVSAAGGAALATTLGYALCAFGAQTFYPVEGSVGMWCLAALATRVRLDAVAVAAGVKPTPAALVSRSRWPRPGHHSPAVVRPRRELRAGARR
jgi:O-antigen ligase